MLFLFAAYLDDPSKKQDFERFITEYQQVMIGVAREITGNYHDAEEAVFDALFAIARVFTKVSLFAREEQKAYACRAAQNRAFSLVNRQNRHRKSEILLDADLLGIGDRELTRACEATESEVVAECLKELDLKYRVVLDLFYAEQRSTGEIAKELGMKRETVKTLLKRGRAKLKIMLEERGVTR